MIRPTLSLAALSGIALAVAASLGGAGSAGAHEGHRHSPRPSHPVIAVSPDMKIGGLAELRDHDGRPFTLGAPTDRPTLVFFGYVSCPGVCPTTLTEARQIHATLGPERAPRTVFVTLDPERDTQAVLKAYMGAFDASFTGLSGTPEQIARVAELYRVGFRKVLTGSSYTIEHSAYIYLLDESGRVVRLYRHGAEAAVLVRDLLRLKAREAAWRLSPGSTPVRVRAAGTSNDANK
jgi:protein SCO1/2